MIRRGLISLAVMAAIVWALVVMLRIVEAGHSKIAPSLSVHADSGNPGLRADFVEKLQEQLNTTMVRAEVHVEGPNGTVLCVTRLAISRRELESLFHPYWDDLPRQGFETVRFCTSGKRACTESYIKQDDENLR
ncbi:hypothetical protein [Bradyrhizobium prioriisuperbiae]|uniref:hypothetical protein n=1 Tax=Bradyrhizobium prioriisuperbiae TaxID=2854389 RepID=UPI0028E19C8F|nr:hypothetical protein [Bradyrhizobium prioritasuperba]